MAAEVQPSVQAIDDGRQLLDEPDPIKPLLDEVTNALRAEVTRQAETLAAAQRKAVEELGAWPEWSKLEEKDREAIESEAKLRPESPPDVDTDAKLLEALDALPIAGWRDRISLVPSRRDQAKHKAATLLEPESVTVRPPTATLKTAAELDAYLAELRKQILAHLEDDKTVVL